MQAYVFAPRIAIATAMLGAWSSDTNSPKLHLHVLSGIGFLANRAIYETVVYDAVQVRYRGRGGAAFFLPPKNSSARYSTAVNNSAHDGTAALVKQASQWPSHFLLAPRGLWTPRWVTWGEKGVEQHRTTAKRLATEHLSGVRTLSLGIPAPRRFHSP